MKLNTRTSEVERGGITHENEFTIKTTAKAFDILSSGLYSDKILAIVRELSCNAYDAHVAAGTEDTPFEIHLPNSLEPFFSVKDYGTGLSDEDIRGELVPVLIKNKKGESVQAVDGEGNPEFKRVGGLYTTYFDSTKTDSNDFIGALGLGSKSPFSYTRAFEVISRHNGTIRIYGIFINEHGVPTVALMSECKTLEPNGLEVKLTVHRHDFNQFSQKTAEALQFFPKKPTVTGSSYFSFKEMPEASLQSKDPNNEWFLVKARHGKITVIQGNVQYPLDKGLVEDVLSPAEKTFLTEASAVLYFNMGELEVAASREAIQYDPRTKQNIKNKIAAVLKDITTIVNEQIKKPGITYWKLASSLNGISDALFGKTNVLSVFLSNLEGVKSNARLKRYVDDAGSVKYTRLRMHTAYLFRPAPAWVSLKRKYRRQELHGNISPEDNIIVVIDDIPHGGASRIGYALEQNPTKQFIGLMPEKSKEKLSWLQTHGGVDNLEKAFKAEKDNWIKELCGPMVIRASDLPSRPREESSRGARTDKFYTWYRRSRYPYRGRWEETTKVGIETGGYYVVANGAARMYDKNNQVSKIEDRDFNMLTAIAEHVEKQRTNKAPDDYVKVNIVGVRPAVAKKLRKSKKWTNVFDLANKLASDLGKLRAVKNALDNERTKQFGKHTGNLGVFDVLFTPDVAGRLESENTKLYKMLTPLRKTQTELAQATRIIGVLESFKYFVYESEEDEPKLIVNVPKIAEQLRDAYPMLFLMNGDTALLNPDIVVSYILSMEKSKRSTGAK